MDLSTLVYKIKTDLNGFEKETYISEAIKLLEQLGMTLVEIGTYCFVYSNDTCPYVIKITKNSFNIFKRKYNKKIYLIPEFVSDNKLLVIQRKAIVMGTTNNEIATKSMDSFLRENKVKMNDIHKGNIGFRNGRSYIIDLDNHLNNKNRLRKVPN